MEIPELEPSNHIEKHLPRDFIHSVKRFWAFLCSFSSLIEKTRCYPQEFCFLIPKLPYILMLWLLIVQSFSLHQLCLKFLRLFYGLIIRYLKCLSNLPFCFKVFTFHLACMWESGIRDWKTFKGLRLWQK